MGTKTKGTLGLGFVYVIDFLTNGQLSNVLFGSLSTEELTRAGLCWIGTLLVGPIWTIPVLNIQFPGVNFLTIISMAFIFIIIRGLYDLFKPAYTWNRKKIVFTFFLTYFISKILGTLLWRAAGTQCVVNALAVDELVGPFTLTFIGVGLLSAIIYVTKHKSWFYSSQDKGM